jgi:hypothetical protein|tara:strand:- start:6999 stop:8579 length:1581 start_codon:yes stop_codon:yes gene_type:complete
MSLTKKEMMAEIVRCGKDPVYFSNKYARISHPLHGLIPFDMYEFQEEALRDFKKHRFNIILKARQLGISTTVASYVAWMMLFHRDKNILIVATKLNTAANLVKKSKAIYKNLPAWLRIASIAIDNRNSFELTNGSVVKASSTSGDAGRSEALSLLVIDEAAIVEGLDEMWAGLYPTLSTGGTCIALSTPYGVGNWFHKNYVEAEEGKNDFNPMKLPWTVHPERDEKWFIKETRNMSKREIAQELECNFNASGETVVHGDDLKRILENICEPNHRTGFDRNYWIWEQPVEGRDYIAVADVARGDGSDFSVCQILDLQTMQQVAEYQGKITPDMFAPHLCSMASEYNNALLVIENNSLGIGVLSRIEEIGYSNIYYSVRATHEYVDQATAEAIGGVPGFTMSMKTRPLVIAKFEEFVRNKLITINSRRLANEVKTFVWHNGRPQAMRGYNDDLVIASCIGCWVRDTALTVNKREIEYKKAMISGITVSNSTFNTKIEGMQGYKPTGKPQNTFEGNDGKKYDLSWIIKG